jgi:hypothetical protein
MHYILYTTVDITNTGQHRVESGKETLRWKEQNFQTVLQTIGIRANISAYTKPQMLEIGGKVIGFNTNSVIKVWRFDFETERDGLFESQGDPIGFLLDDFEMVPYISGLDESMTQNYDVFVTQGPSRNVVFQKKQ